MPDWLTEIRRLRREVGVLGVLRRGMRVAYCEFLTLLAMPLRRRRKDDPFRSLVDDFFASLQRCSGLRVLEIGSRNVSDWTHRHLAGANNEYTGFDIQAGENVDVTGDAHQLSRHFPAASFDAVYTIATFEHLLMPWQVAMEIGRVLAPGGQVFVVTHPTWPAHERPWDFWRFSQDAFDALFNRHTGFRILRRAEGVPCAVLPLVRDSVTRGMLRQEAWLSVAVLAEKVGEPDPALAWQLTAGDVIAARYPSRSP